MLERTEFQLKGDINGLREQWPRARCAAIIYLVLTFRTDPHAFGNVFEGWFQAVEVVDTRTCITHEQLSTASAHSAEILMDVSIPGAGAGLGDRMRVDREGKAPRVRPLRGWGVGKAAGGGEQGVAAQLRHRCAAGGGAVFGRATSLPGALMQWSVQVSDGTLFPLRFKHCSTVHWVGCRSPLTFLSSALNLFKMVICHQPKRHHKGKLLWALLTF